MHRRRFQLWFVITFLTAALDVMYDLWFMPKEQLGENKSAELTHGIRQVERDEA